MASTIEELGGLDILVPQVSAGGGDPSEKGWAANFQTDIMGTVRAVESSIEALRASNGSIVMISTTTAIEEGPGSGPYGAVKAGLLNYSNHLAQTEGANVLARSGYFKAVGLDHDKSGTDGVGDMENILICTKQSAKGLEFETVIIPYIDKLENCGPRKLKEL